MNPEEQKIPYRQSTHADFINIGMVRVWGLQKTETNLELVTKRVGNMVCHRRYRGNGHGWRFHYIDVEEN